MKFGAMTASALLTVAASGAQARPGCVYQDAFLFSDPTYLGSLIGTIPAPAPVEVVRKGKKWSIISFDGESGYVATSHLVPGSKTRPDPPPINYDQSLSLRRTPTFWTGTDYFWGYNRSYWTSRRDWRRETYLAPDDPAWAACGLPIGGKR